MSHRRKRLFRRGNSKSDNDETFYYDENVIEDFLNNSKIQRFDRNTTVDECIFYIKSFLVPHIYDYFKDINSRNANKVILCENEALTFYFDDAVSSTITAFFSTDKENYKQNVIFFLEKLCTVIDEAIYYANKFFLDTRRNVYQQENTSKISLGKSQYALVKRSENISYYGLDNTDYASINIDIVDSKDEIVSYEIVSIWKSPKGFNSENYVHENNTDYDSAYIYYNSGNFYDEEDSNIEKQVMEIYDFPKGRKGFIEIPMTYKEVEDNFYVLDLGWIIYDLVEKINKIYDYSEEINSVYYPEEEEDYTVTIAFNRTYEDEKFYIKTRLEIYLNAYAEIIQNLNLSKISLEKDSYDLLGYNFDDTEYFKEILYRMEVVDRNSNILSEFNLKDLYRMVKNLVI